VVAPSREFHPIEKQVLIADGTSYPHMPATAAKGLGRVGTGKDHAGQSIATETTRVIRIYLG